VWSVGEKGQKGQKSPKGWMSNCVGNIVSKRLKEGPGRVRTTNQKKKALGDSRPLGKNRIRKIAKKKTPGKTVSCRRFTTPCKERALVRVSRKKLAKELSARNGSWVRNDNKRKKKKPGRQGEQQPHLNRYVKKLSGGSCQHEAVKRIRIHFLGDRTGNGLCKQNCMGGTEN